MPQRFERRRHIGNEENAEDADDGIEVFVTDRQVEHTPILNSVFERPRFAARASSSRFAARSTFGFSS